LSAPLVADLESWLRQQRGKLSRSNDLAKAMDYIAGRPSPASSMTDGSAFRTTPPSERYAELPSAESHGYSPVPTAAASAPQ
jgi:transposase